MKHFTLQSLARSIITACFFCTFSTLLAQRQRPTRQTTIGYGIDRNHVYYDGNVLHDADPRTFTYMGHGYGKDRYRVYFKGFVLKEADPRTFRVVGDNEKDYPYRYENGQNPNQRPYTNEPSTVMPDQLLPGNPMGFGYSKDAFDVYHNGKKMADASVSTFNVLTDGYAKDAFNAYFEGSKMADVSVSSFQCLGNGVAKDTFNKYYLGKKVKY